MVHPFYYAIVPSFPLPHFTSFPLSLFSSFPHQTFGFVEQCFCLNSTLSPHSTDGLFFGLRNCLPNLQKNYSIFGFPYFFTKYYNRFQ